jgi:hypothetical protein
VSHADLDVQNVLSSIRQLRFGYPCQRGSIPPLPAAPWVPQTFQTRRLNSISDAAAVAARSFHASSGDHQEPAACDSPDANENIWWAFTPWSRAARNIDPPGAKRRLNDSTLLFHLAVKEKRYLRLNFAPCWISHKSSGESQKLFLCGLHVTPSQRAAQRRTNFRKCDQKRLSVRFQQKVRNGKH